MSGTLSLEPIDEEKKRRPRTGYESPLSPGMSTQSMSMSKTWSGSLPTCHLSYSFTSPKAWVGAASLSAEKSPMFTPAIPPARSVTAQERMKPPPHDAPDEALDAWTQRLWNRLDRDHSGTITRKELEDEEFTKLLKVAAGGDANGGGGASYTRSQMCIPEALNFCLRQADVNGDGQFSKSEFKSLVLALRESQGSRHGARLIFALFDLDQNRYIKHDEFHGLYRFLLGHEPTAVQLKEEWDRLARVGHDEVATYPEFIRWMQTSPTPVINAHAPPVKTSKQMSETDAFTSTGGSTHLPDTPWQRQSASTPKASRAKPLHMCPKWKKTFTQGLNPGHYNDTRPAGTRQYFARSQTDPQLRRFFSEHEGFDKHLEKLNSPLPERTSAALIPKSLSSEGGTPLTLPERHGPAGSMKYHGSDEVFMWEDGWQTPLRNRSRAMSGRANAFYRPLAPKALFSEYERMPRPSGQRAGPMAMKALRASRSTGRMHDYEEVTPARATAYEAEPW